MAEGRTDNWPLYCSVCYMGGRGVSFGEPLLHAGQTASGVYSVRIDSIAGPGVAGVDTTLELLRDESLDHLFVGQRLESLQDQEGFLREAARKLKLGKHLVVYTNIREKEEPGLFPLTPEKVEGLVGKVGRWQKKIQEQRDGRVVQVYKRLKGTSGVLPIQPEPRGPKGRACVVRFGALGDAIILTPLLRKLKEDGYHVSYVSSKYSSPVLQGNPNIDNLLLQERDAVPNLELGQYWDYWKGRYDRYINLSETLEGDLLLVEGRPEFFTRKEWRHKRCNRNYYDYTLARGGYPEVTGQRGELFFTSSEEREAEKFWKPLRGKFTILWALNGSSHHKVYPLMEPVLRKFLKDHPDSVAVTVGDDLARLLEFSHPQVIEKAGKWSIRESLIATREASVVVGPETMITNAAGCWDTPKIVLLSHSSRENLTKYFVNDYSLEPDPKIAPCHPCWQLHYTKGSCPFGKVQDGDTGEIIGEAPICAVATLPTRVYDRLEEVYQKHYIKKG